MRKHYLYRIYSNSQVHYPGRIVISAGDPMSWFLYYKWPSTLTGIDEQDERYVPRGKPYFDLKKGDILWFVLDSVLFGCVEVLRADEDVGLSNVQEIWYNTSSARLMQGKKKRLNAWRRERVADQQGERWMQNTGLTP